MHALQNGGLGLTKVYLSMKFLRIFLAAVARTTSSEESPNKPRVLIVDDNADMREYLQNLLTESYDLEVACDGLHALEIVARKLPELVLTDIMMPKMDG